MLIREILIKTEILLGDARKYSNDIFEQMDYITTADHDNIIRLEALRELIQSQIGKEDDGITTI